MSEDSRFSASDLFSDGRVVIEDSLPNRGFSEIYIRSANDAKSLINAAKRALLMLTTAKDRVKKSPRKQNGEQFICKNEPSRARSVKPAPRKKYSRELKIDLIKPPSGNIQERHATRLEELKKRGSMDTVGRCRKTTIYLIGAGFLRPVGNEPTVRDDTFVKITQAGLYALQEYRSRKRSCRKILDSKSATSVRTRLS